jgi:hypothetical protein
LCTKTHATQGDFEELDKYVFDQKQKKDPKKVYTN